MDFLKAIFDPAGIFGNWEDTPGGPPPAPKVRQPPPGFTGDKFSADEEKPNPFAGFIGQMSGGNDPIAQAFDPNVKVRPSDWSAQWAYTPGKGPQWIEPQRVSSDNNVPYAAVVNTGPAKGNRI